MEPEMWAFPPELVRYLVGGIAAVVVGLSGYIKYMHDKHGADRTALTSKHVDDQVLAAQYYRNERKELGVQHATERAAWTEAQTQREKEYDICILDILNKFMELQDRATVASVKSTDAILELKGSQDLYGKIERLRESDLSREQ